MMDTIAAIASATGEGSIGIIRLSGEDAENILKTIFKPAGRDGDFSSSFSGRSFIYGHVVDPASGQIVDEAMAVMMRAPKTYTREDTAEIYCHGSLISLRKTLDLTFLYGARPAERGEFTKRAFLNGRLDLSQAEAVMDLISAKTDRVYGVAMSQLEGFLSDEVKKIRTLLLDVLVELTVNLDYPDEDIEELTYERLVESLLQISDMIQILERSTGKGKILREGLYTAIIGRPNVGKSSLLNALLREQRAIVTDIPGTTRDTIEELVDIKGIPVMLIDTAGIRYTEDKVESIGIEKAKSRLHSADLVIFMADVSDRLSEEDKDILSLLEPQKTIVLLNKADLAEVIRPDEIREILSDVRIIHTVLVQNKGVTELEEMIYEMAYGGEIAGNHEVLVTNARQTDLIKKSLLSICDSIAAAKMQEAFDFIEVDVKQTYELLGEIVGETVSDDIIDEVFARFCLGK